MGSHREGSVSFHHSPHIKTREDANRWEQESTDRQRLSQDSIQDRGLLAWVLYLLLLFKNVFFKIFFLKKLSFFIKNKETNLDPTVHEIELVTQVK